MTVTVPGKKPLFWWHQNLQVHVFSLYRHVPCTQWLQVHVISLYRHLPCTQWLQSVSYLSIHMYLVPTDYRSMSSLCIHMYLVPSGYSSMSNSFPFLCFVCHTGSCWFMTGFWLFPTVHCVLAYTVCDIPFLHPRLPFHLMCQSHVLHSPSTFTEI